METIKIRFASNKTLVSKIVRFFTRSEYSHVDYIFDTGEAYSSLPHTGVNYNTDSNDVEVMCEVEVESKKLVENFLLSQQGKPYDLTAIFGFIFSRDWQEKDQWFCSELIAAAIQNGSSKPLYNTRLNRITPRDLFIHPSVKEIK